VIDKRRNNGEPGAVTPLEDKMQVEGTLVQLRRSDWVASELVEVQVGDGHGQLGQI
jgi:hypothetical protein